MRHAGLFLFCGLLLLTNGCEGDKHPHDHSTAHPSGHDHHEEGHGHGDTPVASQTLWNSSYEVFTEHDVVRAGEEMGVLLHITDLDGFRALKSGKLTLELEGPASLQASTSTGLRPGIFRIKLVPVVSGTYQGSLRISRPQAEAGDSAVAPVPGTPATDEVVEGFEIRVLDHDATAPPASTKEAHEGLIEFLKEQQWGVPFGTAFAETGTVLESIEVPGRVETPPGGDAEVGAPVAGQVALLSDGLPRPGTLVRKGQVLASLAPIASSPEAAARASLVVAEAAARLAAADSALARAQRLIRDGAISQRELEDARREARVAKESAEAARRNAELYETGPVRDASTTWPLISPIDGILVSVDARPGAIKAAGERLFRIVDPSSLWIVARVPEHDASRLRSDRNPRYQIPGEESWTEIPVRSNVTIASVVDPRSRTVAATYPLTDPAPGLRVDALVRVSVPAGDEFQGVVIPRSALIDQDGRSTVYVQMDGEHFEERLVRTGPRSAGEVAITQGLSAGERIVVKGAHLVRLADKASGPESHGHIH